MTDRYNAPTPTVRLAQLALEALDSGADDDDMARICLRRIIELGGKT